MTKTYEVHGAHPEQQCDDVEHHQAIIEHTTCCQRWFVPRYPDILSDVEVGAVGDDLEKKEDQDGTSRTRVYSEDVTVATNFSSPPATPDPTASSDEPGETLDRLNSDLDPPSIKTKIPSICEEVEENESSGDESNSFLLANPTPGINLLIPKTKLDPSSSIDIKGTIPDGVDESESSAAEDVVIHC